MVDSGPEKGAPGSEDIFRKMTVEQAANLLRPGEEQARLYPIEGEDLLTDLLEAELEELPDVLDRTMAFEEGLIFGPEGKQVYELAPREPEPGKVDYSPQLLWLHNLFTTVEDSTDRPSATYVDTAAKNAIQERLRSAQAWFKHPDQWEKSYRRRLERQRIPKEIVDSVVERKQAEFDKIINNEEAVRTLVDLTNRRKARRVIDTAFLQRQATCTNPELAANMSNQDRNYRLPVTPDKGHWQAFFSGEFGDKVDTVLREIVRMGMAPEGKEFPEGEKKNKEMVRVDMNEAGIPATVYSTGFESTTTFLKWAKYLLEEKAGGRMDVVWAAWRVAQLWELTSQFGISKIKETDDKGKVTEKYEIGVPPIVNALGPWIMHLDEKQELEWGLDTKGTRLITGRYLDQTGYPLNFLGPKALESLSKAQGVTLETLKRRNPCNSYLHETKVKMKISETETQKITLWERWWGNPKKGIGEMKLSDPAFPWFLAEELQRGGDEISPGSFEGWLLRRYRAFRVIQDIRSSPPLNELVRPDFFASRVRVWDKVFDPVGTEKPGDKDYLQPYQNPRTWWVAGIIHARYPRAPKALVEKNKAELDHRYHQRSEVAELLDVGQDEHSRAIKEILDNAILCGFLRPADADWIVTNIGG
jgi:hypothetical protein